MNIAIQKATKENFAKYGEIICLDDLGQATIDVGVVQFWAQQSGVDFGGELEVGVLRVKKHDMIFDELENHFKTPTLMLCLDGDFILPLAPCQDAVPSVSEIEALYIKQGDLYKMNAKCWHGEVYPVDKEILTLLVFLKKDSLDDDTVYEKLSEQCVIV